MLDKIDVNNDVSKDLGSDFNNNVNSINVMNNVNRNIKDNIKDISNDSNYNNYNNYNNLDDVNIEEEINILKEVNISDDIYDNINTVSELFYFNLSDLDKCINCNFCKVSCPIYYSTSKEFYSPRSRLYRLKNNDFDFVCTSCGFCEEVCPVNIKFNNSRLRKNFSTFKETSFNKKMLDNFKKFNNPFGEKL